MADHAMGKTDELGHFVDAQRNVMPTVLAELAAGEKRSHWMWFVFPQIAGLGNSSMAQRYALADADAARRYLAHPVLGERLRTCTALVAGLEGRDVHQIFGSPDDLKFCSCMTLFAAAAPAEHLFTDCLEKYCDGVPDNATLTRLARAQRP